jgi:haloalkane dehalogenase
MKVYQTPEARFASLKDFPFHPHYTYIKNLRLHYIDEGPADSRAVLLLHGVPTWSYLYRHMISKISGAGYRVIAPDLIGFGRSDKPGGTEFHKYQIHIDIIHDWLSLIKVRDIILFAHDWGSLIGLRIAAEEPELFSGIIICNGMLPTGGQTMHYLFTLWKYFARYSPYIPVDTVLDCGMGNKLSKEERIAYNAPFPSGRYMAGIRALPGRVPVTEDDPESAANRKAWEVLSRWQKPFLTIFSSNDPVTRGGDKFLQSNIPGSAGQPHLILEGGHFIQEEKSDEISRLVLEFIKRTDSQLTEDNNS